MSSLAAPRTAAAVGTPLATDLRVAAAYVRVSTARQEDEETAKVQVAEVQDRAKADGIALPPENIFVDDGWTGSLLARPGLDQARRAGAEGCFQVLYTYDRGRIARKFSYQEIVIEELEERGIRFVPLHDREVATEEDRLLQGVQGLFAEWERTKIADRFRIAKQRRAESGRIINGQALYGYRILRRAAPSGDNRHEEREYVVHDEEARVVRLMFQWVGREGVSLREVQRRLYHMGIKPRFSNKPCWSMGPITRLLRTDTYATGIAHYNKSEAVVGRHPRRAGKYRRIKKDSRKVRPREQWVPFTVPKVIDAELFERVRRVFARNQNKASRGPRSDRYLLTGLVHCACGFKRTGDGGTRGNYYYRCAQRIYQHPLPSECWRPGINSQALDRAVAAAVRDHLSQPAHIRAAVENHLAQLAKHDATSGESAELERLLAKAKEEQRRYAVAYAQGTLELETFQELASSATKRVRAHEKQLADLKAAAGPLASEVAIETLCAEVGHVIAELDFAAQPGMLRSIITRVIIKDRTTAQVCGEFPLQPNQPEKLGYEPTGRNCRVTKRWKVDVI